ncbi:hypothetical protein NPIL_38941, partial [Nephila pilipes]
NLSSIQNSSDYLSIAIFAENKLNCLSNFMFPDINVNNNISVDLIKIIEEARLKFSILKHQEMKDDLNQFTNLCQSWGIQNPATQTPFVLAKPRQRKNSLPGETSKKQKLEATTCQNKFSVLSIEDPPEELQIDEPLPPSPTPEKTTTKPKKKHGPSKKPASLANKQPPAPTPRLCSGFLDNHGIHQVIFETAGDDMFTCVIHQANIFVMAIVNSKPLS